MTVDTIIVGIDPGEVTGIAKLRIAGVAIPRIVAVDFCQVTSEIVIPVLEGLTGYELGQRIVVATERFVVGPRASRSARGKAGTVARDIVTLARSWAGGVSAEVVERSAAEVKPWATDERLDRAGLLGKAQGMRHAKDAGRHALFEAVRNHGVADPLSARAGAR